MWKAFTWKDTVYQNTAVEKPNIVFIMADGMGSTVDNHYGDIDVAGQLTGRVKAGSSCETPGAATTS